jgi:hypothetical protein
MKKTHIKKVKPAKKESTLLAGRGCTPQQEP